MRTEERLLKDLLVATKDGDWGKGDPTDGHIPYRVIRGTDFEDVAVGNRANVPLRHLSENTVTRRRLVADDILIETAGGSPTRPTGRTMLVTQPVLDGFEVPATCASFARFLRVDSALANPRYVFWFLRFLYLSGQIEQYQVQHTGVARFQYTQFATKQLVPLPPRGIQHAIAEVLGALDDKIAANLKLAATSDALAVAHFASIARNLALSACSFSDLADVGGGGTPRTSVAEYWEGDIPWATPTDVTALDGPYLRDTTRKISDRGLANCASSLYAAGSILMTSRATIGAFAITQVAVAVNQGFIVVNAKDARYQWWLFHEMRSRVSEFLALANGATFLELPRGRFKQLEVRLPSEDEIEAFDTRATALHGVAAGAIEEAKNLATLRDTLLPQLMSGTLRVRDAERQVAEAL